MKDRKESAPTIPSRGADVTKTRYIIPQKDWERGCRAFPVLFALFALALLATGGL